MCCFLSVDVLCIVCHLHVLMLLLFTVHLFLLYLLISLVALVVFAVIFPAVSLIFLCRDLPLCVFSDVRGCDCGRVYYDSIVV